MLRILSAFLISLAASFFATPFALAFDGPPGPGEEWKQPPSPTDRLTGSLATDLVKACQLADPDDVPAFELCRPQEQQAQQEQDRQQQAQQELDRQRQAEQQVKQVQHQQNAADQGTVGQSTEPKSE
jgi:hypothetical protein